MDIIDLMDRMLLDYEEHKQRADRLYVTDVGKCPRAVAYALMSSPKRERSAQEQANLRFMFRLARHIEEDVGRALAHAGITYETQYPLPIDDRENWGGRPDFVIIENGEISKGIEVKSIRSTAFKFPLPKTEHVYQKSIYEHYLVVPFSLVYYDRGGANTPQVHTDHTDDFIALMDELDVVRENLPDLPPQLDRVLKMTDKKRGTEQYTKVKLVPDWRCEYCDYNQSVCFPDMATETWAEWNVGWKFKKVADIDRLALIGVFNG